MYTSTPYYMYIVIILMTTRNTKRFDSLAYHTNNTQPTS